MISFLLMLVFTGAVSWYVWRWAYWYGYHDAMEYRDELDHYAGRRHYDSGRDFTA